MINYQYENLFKQDSVAKELSITGTGISITNQNMDGERFSIEEILNSGRDLNFGECNSAKLSFSVGYYDKSIVGTELTAKTTPSGGTAFQFGKYRVVSDEPTADRKWRDVVAYDALYEILKLNVASWYNSILPNANSSMTLKQFRDSFFTLVGITQKSVELVNDSITITRTVDPKVLTGKSVLNAICQLNGCFGRIGRDGQFEYVFLAVPAEGLFPADDLYPADDLFPEEYGFESNERFEHGTYISCKYEDFLTQVIDKLEIRLSDDSPGVSVGSGDNVYIIKNNFLLFDKDSTALTSIANNILGVIGGVWYRPCNVDAVGNPCLECGDGIRINTTDRMMIDTIILKRKIKGIQSLKDNLIADGLERRENDENTLQEQIVQIKGNIRKVEADIIETNLLIASEIQADRARIGDLEADHVSVADLQATNAKFNNLNADNITAGTLSVSRLNIDSLLLSFAGKQIGCDTITAGTIQAVNTILFRQNGVYHSLFLNTIPASDTVGGHAYNYVGWN